MNIWYIKGFTPDGDRIMTMDRKSGQQAYSMIPIGVLPSKNKLEKTNE